MTELQKGTMKAVAEYLDELMQEQPSRELADCSNYLQALLDKEV